MHLAFLEQFRLLLANQASYVLGFIQSPYLLLLKLSRQNYYDLFYFAFDESEGFFRFLFVCFENQQLGIHLHSSVQIRFLSLVQLN